MGLFRKPSLSRMLGISAAKAKLSRQLGFSVTKAAKGIFVPTRVPRPKRAPASALLTFRSYAPPRRSAVIVAEPSDPNSTVIRISAREIAFPNLCPCCLGPADDLVSVAYTRPNGEQKGWDVPHCRACLEYNWLFPQVQEDRAAYEEERVAAEDRFREVQGEVHEYLANLRVEEQSLKARRQPKLATSLVMLIACGGFLSLIALLLSVWIFIILLGLTWLISVPLVVCWPQILDWLDERHAKRVRENAENLRSAEAEAPSILAHERAETDSQIQDAAARHNELVHRVNAAARSGRLEIGRLPVEYLGWEGTIHSFAIAHPGFAEAFRAVNANKKVW